MALPGGSLRFRTLLIATLAAIPAVLLLLVSYVDLQRLGEREAALRASEAEGAIRALLEDVEADGRALLSAVSLIGEVREAEVDPEACRSVLARLGASGETFRNLLRLDPDGVVLCSAAPTAFRSLPTSPGGTAIQAHLVEDGRFRDAGAISAGGDRALTLHVRAVNEPGAPHAGSLLLTRDLVAEEARLRRTWPAGLALYLFSPDGELLLGIRNGERAPPSVLPSPVGAGTDLGNAPDPGANDAAIPRPPGGNAEVAPAADSLLGTLTRGGHVEEILLARHLTQDLRGRAPLLVIGTTPATDFLPGTGFVLRSMGLFGVVTLLALLLSLLWLRRIILSPVETLTEAVGEIQKGNFEARVPSRSLPDEFRSLARTFNRMGEALVERRRESAAAQAEVERSEARYRYLFHRSPFPMWVYDVDSLAFLDVNAAAVEEYGFSEEEFRGMTILDIRPPEDREVVRRSVRGSRAGMEAGDDGMERSGAWTHLRRDGSLLHAEIRSRPIPLEGHRARLVLSLDVTDRVEAQAGLRESERRLQEILGNVEDTVWMQDASTLELLYVSPAFERIWGRPREDLLGGELDFVETIHPDDREATREARRHVPDAPQTEEYRIVRPDGSVRWIHDRSFPVRDAAGVTYRLAGIASDITERVDLEKRLRRSQRLEAVGQLAGGIAHDFNNLLTVIRGHLNLLLASDDLEPAIREELVEADHASVRAGELVWQLLAFSRRQVLLPRVLDLNRVVEGTERMLRRIVDDPVEIFLETATVPLWVQVDQGQLEQVVVNLVLNARDALPRGGHLHIRTTDHRMGREAGVDGEIPAGRYCVLEVEDNGVGMPPHVASRAFDPFFTTKEAGRGTGLGLATVHGVVAQSGGHIQLRSVRGEGTRFRIFLTPVPPPD